MLSASAVINIESNTADAHQPAVAITLRITSLADPTQVIEASSTYSGSCWNDKLILIWHNTNLAGQFSNIEWSTGGAQ